MGGGALPLVITAERRGVAAYALRPMRLADLGAVVRLEESWAARPWSLATFRKELGARFSRACVLHPARAPHVVAGYRICSLVAGAMDLLSLAVCPRERRRGLGGFMLDHLVREASRGCAESITLEVAVSNVAARRLYSTRGFGEVRVRKGYYGAGRDAVVMERRLGRAVS